MESSKNEFVKVENLENVWKRTVEAGNSEVKDEQEENSPWTNKPRNVMFEFLFTLTGQGDPVSNEDEEDPEEFILAAEGAKASNDR